MGLDDTLEALDRLEQVASGNVEVVVVDASSGRLEHIRARHPRARWIDFAPFGHRTSIPHQRNVAVRESASDTLIFIDASCIPEDGWLERMLQPIEQAGETIVAGSSRSSGTPSIRDHTALILGAQKYLREAPTLNLALRRSVYDQLDGSNEALAMAPTSISPGGRGKQGAGSDTSRTPVVRHDWGSPVREMRQIVRLWQGTRTAIPEAQSPLAGIVRRRHRGPGLSRLFGRPAVLSVSPVALAAVADCDPGDPQPAPEALIDGALGSICCMEAESWSQVLSRWRRLSLRPGRSRAPRIFG